VLWAHRHDQPPIGRARSIDVTSTGLRSVYEPPPRGVYPFADQVFDLAKAGFLNATSVGFRPTRSRYNEARKGIDYLEQELLEWSIVSVPANPEALIEARSRGVSDRAALDRFLGGGVDLDELPQGQIRDAIRDGVRAAIASVIRGEADRAVRAVAFKITGKLGYLHDAAAPDRNSASARAYKPTDIVLDLDASPSRDTEAGRQAMCHEAYREHARRERVRAEADAVWDAARAILRHGTREQVASLREQFKAVTPNDVSRIPHDVRSLVGLPLLWQ
jgi:HK97 family phage prohead protease